MMTSVSASRWVWYGMASAVPLTFVLALSVGRIAIHPLDALAWLAGDTAQQGSDTATAYTVLGSLRLPRALLLCCWAVGWVWLAQCCNAFCAILLAAHKT